MAESDELTTELLPPYLTGSSKTKPTTNVRGADFDSLATAGVEQVSTWQLLMPPTS